jgi:hypothetical protein
MKRWIPALSLLSLMIVASVAPGFAAPLAQDQRPVIVQPEADATVRGVVQIVGTATHAQFQRYELYYAPWPVPSEKSWIFIGPDAHFQAQALGSLGTWDSRAVTDGAYALKVRVVRADANYVDSEARRVVVANRSAAGSATPDLTKTPASPTPTNVPTMGPLSSTATIVVLGPSGATRTPVPSATKPASGASAQSTAILDADPAEQPADQLLDSSRLLDVARTTAFATVGLFVAIGLFFAVKGLLSWLWQRARP